MGNRSLEGGQPNNKTGCPKGKVVRKLLSNNLQVSAVIE